ncbi:MAG: 4-(cytidine 5'-diphospho)-2-C-methyl-D-erythritol kinase [Candidatus Aminicenantes bacterium]|jgi:4-diphosphocytidyl-2-C-methyl-D-erythritol kinase
MKKKPGKRFKSCSEMKLYSFAKINLGLEVLDRKEDGYHEVRTLLQSVSLHDVLEFRSAPADKILLRGNDKSIPWDERNLIYKAAQILKEHQCVSAGVEVWADKRIPPGMGLGGGSSNAAMTLYALDKLWGLNLKKRELMELGKKLGTDVPFFLEGGLCLGLGRGEEVESIQDLPSYYCVLVLPETPIMTASVYSQFRPSLTSDAKVSKIIGFLKSRRLHLLENSLEETVFRSYPQIEAIKRLFQSTEPELSLMSGSGSAVFGLYREERKAREALDEVNRIHPSLLVETIPRERYWSRVFAGV